MSAQQDVAVVDTVAPGVHLPLAMRVAALTPAPGECDRCGRASTRRLVIVHDEAGERVGAFGLACASTVLGYPVSAPSVDVAEHHRIRLLEGHVNAARSALFASQESTSSGAYRSGRGFADQAVFMLLDARRVAVLPDEVATVAALTERVRDHRAANAALDYSAQR